MSCYKVESCIQMSTSGQNLDQPEISDLLNENELA